MDQNDTNSTEQYLMNVPHKKKWDQIMKMDGKTAYAFRDTLRPRPVVTTTVRERDRIRVTWMDTIRSPPVTRCQTPLIQWNNVVTKKSGRLRRSAPASDECPMVRSISSH